MIGGLQPPRYKIYLAHIPSQPVLSNSYQRLTLHRQALKFAIPPPISPSMVNPISSLHTSQANEAKPAAPKPQSTPQKSAPQPSDTVTLKSTAKAGNSGDSH
jgi:hypothetical protein